MAKIRSRAFPVPASACSRGNVYLSVAIFKLPATARDRARARLVSPRLASPGFGQSRLASPPRAALHRVLGLATTCNCLQLLLALLPLMVSVRTLARSRANERYGGARERARSPTIGERALRGGADRGSILAASRHFRFAREL